MRTSTGTLFLSYHGNKIGLVDCFCSESSSQLHPRDFRNADDCLVFFLLKE